MSDASPPAMPAREPLFVNAFRFLQAWRKFEGHVRGLAQSSIEGEVVVTPPPAPDLEAIDRIVVASLAMPEPLPDAGPDIHEALLVRLICWSAQVRRQSRLAVCPQYRITRLDGPGPSSRGGVRFRVTVPGHQKDVVLLTLQGVARVIDAAILEADRLPTDRSAATLMTTLAQDIRQFAPGSFNHPLILDAAFRLDIPVSGLMGLPGLRLGTGRHARIMESSVTDETSYIGMRTSQDKQITARVLRAAGLPGAVHELVDSAEAALAAAGRLGYPVVVKPSNLDQGRGVAANLRSDASLRKAYEAARALSSSILVEKHFEGFGHRLTVFRGDLLAALKRVPGGVTGDGRHSIAELATLRLQDPTVRSNLNYGRVSLDDEALDLLADHGMTPDSVPAPGVFVLLRRRDNLSVGGVAEHISLDAIHPDNAGLAIRAAAVVHLDLAGIDLLIPDIGVSWRESGALICEVNGRPQIGRGEQSGNHRRLVAALVGTESRIPVHLVLESTEDLPPERLRRLTERLGSDTVCSRAGIVRRGVPLTGRFDSGWAAAHAALCDRDTNSLLMAVPFQEVQTHGLAIDRIDSLYVPDHLTANPETAAAVRAAIELCDVPSSRIFMMRTQP